MKLKAMTMLAAFTAMAAHAGGKSQTSADRSVTVCVEGEGLSTVEWRAKGLASVMFANIGVQLNWRNGLRECPERGIMISLTGRTPSDLKPGALAYALPYEGTHVQVFVDRIFEMFQEATVPTVLGYVFVHEITHVLQGVARHSESGVMKAHWTGDDCGQMGCRALKFESKDIDLIGDSGAVGLEPPQRGERGRDSAKPSSL